MATTMMDLKKNLAKLDKRTDELDKSANVVDGAVGKLEEQVKLQSGSGETGEVVRGKLNDGATGEKPAKGLNSKAGSGASANEPFVGVNQAKGTVKDGAKDTQITKACGKKALKKKKTNIKGSAGGVASAKTAKVPAPTKSSK